MSLDPVRKNLLTKAFLACFTAGALCFLFAACGAGGGSGIGSAVNLQQWYSDLTTISARQNNHGYPRLANDTQVSWGGNSANGYLGQSLFSRLHWFDYLVIDGNTSATTSYTSLTNYLGYKGSIRTLNPNSVQVAYFSIADFSNYIPGLCYQPLLTYYAFGSGFNVSTCTDPGNNDFSPTWLYHDISGAPLALYNFGAYSSHIPDPSKSGFQQRYMDSVQKMIIANANVDGLYQDWGGFCTLPSLGGFTTVSLLNNGVDNLGGTGNLTNINNAVNVDWQNGIISLYSQELSSYPSNFILAGNSGWGGTTILPSFTSALQGTQVEDFLNSVASATGWQGAMYTYGTWAMNGKTPNFAFIQADLAFGGATVDSNHLLFDLMVATGNNWLTETQLAQLRFGLASALMFNGYFASSNTNATAGGYSAAFWLDEYAVNSSGTAVVPTDATASAARAAKGWLGSPLAAAFNVATPSQTLWSVVSTGPSNSSNTMVWRRDYTNGIVVVNPTSSGQTVTLTGGPFKKISGVVDPAFNTGATGLTSITLPSQTGVVLRR
jgi:hypothetical protein